MSVKEKRKKKIRFNEEFLTKFCSENKISYIILFSEQNLVK